MGRAPWSLSRSARPPGLLEFLGPREWAACFYSSRLASPLPGQADGDAHLLRGVPPISGAILLARGGLVYPLLDGLGDTEGLGARIEGRGRETTTLMGLARDVSIIEGLLDRSPKEKIAYYLMKLDAKPAAIPAPLPGLSLRPAGPADFGSLYPLQIAYEREEVLVPIHALDERAVALSLGRSLERQIVVMAELEGRAVGKAQTNARGFAWDQLGGIFVEPRLRGKGLGRWMTSALCSELARDGRKACLFARKSNTAAIRSYSAVGFTLEEDFSISYYA